MDRPLSREQQEQPIGALHSVADLAPVGKPCRELIEIHARQRKCCAPVKAASRSAACIWSLRPSSKQFRMLAIWMGRDRHRCCAELRSEFHSPEHREWPYLDLVPRCLTCGRWVFLSCRFASPRRGWGCLFVHFHFRVEDCRLGARAAALGPDKCLRNDEELPSKCRTAAVQSRHGVERRGGVRVGQNHLASTGLPRSADYERRCVASGTVR